ncbi:radical SAM protein [Agarilytica rhodophyticola]|uniref:radical SAM protein n=1 Tax=Agarilytica rhodophyticola TaxID=1737490 RepID=UPI000B3480AC|nr:radical SAM protein [Agarilytica rhodophyticola]
MRPENNVVLDRESFKWVKESMRLSAQSDRARKINPSFATPYPQEIGMQLTYQCNLRCGHCFQWNDKGFFHNYEKEIQRKEIDIDVVIDTLKVTKSVKSRLYFWGGEPLVYSKWDKLCEYMMDDPRPSVICTNALKLNDNFQSIVDLPEHPNLLISVDGLRESHDEIRGKGTFLKVWDNIMPFIVLKQRKKYKGNININLVLNDDNVGELFDLAVMAENMGVDAIYYCFPWFIPTDVAEHMDEYFKENFMWLNPTFGQNGVKASWHSYTHRISEESKAILDEQVAKLNARTWKTRIRFRPDLGKEESMGFLMGTETPGQNRRTCHAVSNRLDILADGSVSSCKLFPEFKLGDLNTENALDIWRGEKYQKLRSIMYKGLTPICSKCIQLYLNGK